MVSDSFASLQARRLKTSFPRSYVHLHQIRVLLPEYKLITVVDRLKRQRVGRIFEFVSILIAIEKWRPRFRTITTAIEIYD